MRYLKELRGNQLIGSHFVITNPDDLAFGLDPWPRRCQNCFYRPLAGNPDCNLIVREGQKGPRELFNIPDGESMPERINELEVGYYCPHYLPEDAE